MKGDEETLRSAKSKSVMTTSSRDCQEVRRLPLVVHDDSLAGQLHQCEYIQLQLLSRPHPCNSNFNYVDFYSMMGYHSSRHSTFNVADLYSVQSTLRRI